MSKPTQCSVCRRTPLIGEWITVMRRGKRESAVCALCIAKPRASALGEAVARDRVRSDAGAASVRVLAPTPVRAPAAVASAAPPPNVPHQAL